MTLALVWMEDVLEMGRGPSQTFLKSFQDRDGLNRLPCILKSCQAEVRSLTETALNIRQPRTWA